VNSVSRPFDLKARAHRALVEAGFHPDFPPEVVAEVREHSKTSPAPIPGTRDLRHLLWSSIDNDQSRDLDQIEYVEELAEGRVIHAAQGIDVGDKVQVRLISVEIDQGFIDFEKI
jgi:exoribonuclease R